MYCRQCFGSNNDPNKCPVERCELRFKETGSHRKPKMTRKEAIELAKKLGNSKPYYESDIALLEALGLLKFDEPKEVKVIFEINLTTGDVTDNAFKYGQELVNKHGAIRLEEWSEGLVLWVGGEIKWKSWEKVARLGTQVTIDTGSYIGNVTRIW